MKKNNKEFHPLTIMSEDGMLGSPRYHFSIDDVFECLIEVTDRNIPLFEHPFFSFLKDMHEKYGIHIGLHLFFQREIYGKIRTLKEIRDLREEVASSGGWLHFGPHALDFPTMPFNQTPEEQIELFDRIYDEIDRIAGNDTYARWVRLHFYSESHELADYFTKRGVTALFSTDRPAGSHRMPTEVGNSLFQKGHVSYFGANFIRTQFRVESFTNGRTDVNDLEKIFKEALDKYGYIIFYTHEYELRRSEVQQSLRRALEALKNLSISSTQHI